MGAYLSEPITEKFSTENDCEHIRVGTSSMQGWRISQEDAHNSIVDFDENTSFFAVYDGHGGAEVATYCAENLPNFFKNLKAYKEGDYEQALKDAFLGFDEILLQEDVINILKKLAGEKNPDRESELAEEEEEDLAELCQEGSLPLDQVLEKYKGAAAKFQNANKLKCDEGVASSSGTSKLSRTLRGRRMSIESPGWSSEFQDEATNKNKHIDSEDLVVSSSSVKHENSILHVDSKIEEQIFYNSSFVKENGSGNALKCTSPDSSSANAEDISLRCSDKFKNGDISSYAESSTAKNEGVSSTSSSNSSDGVSSQSCSKQENGEVSTAPTAVLSSSSSMSSSSSSSSNQEVAVDNNPTLPLPSTKESTENKSMMCPMEHDVNDSSSEEEDDTDFHAEDNSSTEDGEEDCEPCEEETEEENDDEEAEDEECAGIVDDEDDFCSNMIEEPGKDSGCTAVVALLHGKDLYVANAGDSRCVLCRNGEAIEMSLDHKPEDEKERIRIYSAGGKVTMDGRVNGGLNLSRAIGDHAYKMNKDLLPEQQMISAMPDIKKIIITPEDEFMILACDGIWNYMSSEEVVEFIKKRLDEGQEKISEICEDLFDNCLAPHTIGDGTGCDNMTAVIVKFKHPKITQLPSKLPSDYCNVTNADIVKMDVQSSTTTAVAGMASKKRTKSTADNDNDDDENEKNSKPERSNKRLKTDKDYEDNNSSNATIVQAESSLSEKMDEDNTKTNDDNIDLISTNVSTTSDVSTIISNNGASAIESTISTTSTSSSLSLSSLASAPATTSASATCVSNSDNSNEKNLENETSSTVTTSTTAAAVTTTTTTTTTTT